MKLSINESLLIDLLIDCGHTIIIERSGGIIVKRTDGGQVSATQRGRKDVLLAIAIFEINKTKGES